MLEDPVTTYLMGKYYMIPKRIDLNEKNVSNLQTLARNCIFYTYI